ncbi:unnamed protein product [Staurois parvus]|uniref:Uncharacterized protein n=1 Tax=Staurois parvus TaxID=386267 RepID=A0ABN9DE78_9NEOB|nr:unnamed protein product [Staurois parvus]
MYIQTHVNTYTDTCTYIHTNTHTYSTCTYTQTHVQIHTCTYTQTHVQLYMHTQTYTHMYTHTPPTHKKLQYFVIHSQIRVLHSRGRQRAQHTLLALLSLRSAIEQSDGCQCQLQIRPELRACSARRSWGTHSPPP